MEDQTISGPHVQLATFCDMVIEDKTGALSIIRLIDRYTVSGQTAGMQPTPIKTTLAVSLKAGFMRQKAMLKIQPIAPSGKELPALEISALFEGDERGLQFVFPVQMVLEEEGLYWFNLSVDGQSLTRIALRLLYQRLATAAKPEPEPEG
jgi:hypothetical protein